MTMTWFKVHHEIVDDIKIRRFTSQEKWAWIALLCLASKSSERGTIDADEDDIADYCEFNSTQDWLYYRDKLIVKGMIEIGASGKLLIANWHKRQDRKPSDQPEQVKKRVAASRAKKKAESQSPPKPDLFVTPCNAIQVECNADVSLQTRSDQIRGEEKRLDQIREEENTRLEDIYTPPVENFPEPCQPTKEILTADMAEENQETPPPTPAPSPPENVGLAIATTEKPERRKKNVTSEDLIPFKEVWNRDAPTGCRRIANNLTIADEKALRRLIGQYGNRSIEIFQEGLAYARTQKWWNDKNKKLTITNYVSGNKPEDYSENYKAMVEEGTLLSLTASPTDRPMTASDIRKAETYLKYKEALTA